MFAPLLVPWVPRQPWPLVHAWHSTVCVSCVFFLYLPARWSLGVVLYKCIVGLFSHPFLSQAQMLGSCDEETILASIHSAQGRVAWPAGLHVEPALRELVEGLLRVAPGARWGLEQVACCSALDVAAARAVAARGGFEEEMDGLLVRPSHATPRHAAHMEGHMCG